MNEATHPEIQPPPLGFRSAFVALIGRPNSGKSTLLNAILGEQLSIVTPLPQTTRKNIKGIYNNETAQIVFIDTPGIHQGKYALNKVMSAQGSGLIGGAHADIICYIVDLSRPGGPEEDHIAGLVSATAKPALIVFNKVDASPDSGAGRQAFFSRYPRLAGHGHISLSAISQGAAEKFLSALMPLVKPGPRFFPADELTDENMRFFAAEHIRKQIISLTTDEVPHAAFVEITAYTETGDRHRVEATIHVETTGQRGIIVGKKGALIQKIQRMAGLELSTLADAKVTVRCHVKITPNWRDNSGFLSSMGMPKSAKS
jgi:GTP-binding protein Era